jgi:hypothetical protein
MNASISTDPSRIADVEIPMPRPWGYLATVGWLVLAMLVGFICLILYFGVVKWLDPEVQFQPGVANELRLLPTTVAIGVLLAVLALAVRLRHWRIKDYFGLVRPSKREVAIALAFLIVLLAVEGAVCYLTGWGTDYVTNLYVTARAGGLLPLLWLIIGVIFVLSDCRRGDLSRISIPRVGQNPARRRSRNSRHLGPLCTHPYPVRLVRDFHRIQPWLVLRMGALVERVDAARRPDPYCHQSMGHDRSGDGR